MSNQVKSGRYEPRAYYLPGDKSRTPLSHDDYVSLMRDPLRQRAKLRRAGECNVPANHPCCADCCDCPYRTQLVTTSLDALVEKGHDIASRDDFAEAIVRKMLLQQIYSVLPKLDEIDRIIIDAKFMHTPALSDRACAEQIAKRTGRTMSHQAVSKRLPAALERLRQLVGVSLDD